MYMVNIKYHVNTCTIARMLVLIWCLFGAVAAQENPVILASKDFLNEVIAQDKHLTMYYVIHNIGTELASDVKVQISSDQCLLHTLHNAPF